MPPVSHSSLSHIIFCTSDSGTLTSYNPCPSSHIIGRLTERSVFLPVWFVFRNTYACLTPNPRCFRQSSGVSPQKRSRVTTLRTYGCAYDQFALDRLSGKEKCVIYKSIHFCFKFLGGGGDKAESFSGRCSVGCPSLVLLEESSCLLGWREADESSICLDKRWKTIKRTSKDKNPSRGSVTLFFKGFFQRRGEIVVLGCVYSTCIRFILKVSYMCCCVFLTAINSWDELIWHNRTLYYSIRSWKLFTYCIFCFMQEAQGRENWELVEGMEKKKKQILFLFSL